jgi:predicted acylesterase/phospholipase RssA
MLKWIKTLRELDRTGRARIYCRRHATGLLKERVRLSSPRKIALIIAGGTSLGAFEAGVLAELLHGLDTVRRERGERFDVDVITGGSAGSITGALVGRAILHDRKRMSDALYDSWVVTAGIRDFLQAPPRNSILTNQVQETLKERHFGAGRVPYDATHARAHALNAEQESLVLAFSLANLVGVDWGFDYAPTSAEESGRFVSTFFAEYAQFSFSASRPERTYDAVYWSRVADAAIASGTFPFAFPPFGLPRAAADYPGALPPPANRLPGEYLFTDGGMYNNEPVGEAIRHARDIDGGVTRSDRTFVLIDPNLNRSKRDERYYRQPHFFDLVKRIPLNVWSQSQARDWLRSERINAQAKWRDDLVAEMARIVNTIPEGELEPRTNTLRERARAIVAHKLTVRGETPSPTRVEKRLDEGLANLESRHAAELATIGSASAPDLQRKKRELFKMLVYHINSAGAMGRKSTIDLHAIAAEKERTAGDEWMGFLGFFDRRWREHDYRLGRRNTHERLPEILGVAPYAREAGVTYENDPAWPDFASATMADVAPSVKDAFVDHVARQTEVFLSQDRYRVNAVARKALALAAKQVLKSLMKK